MKQIKIFTDDHTKIKTSAKNGKMTIAEVINGLLGKPAPLTVPIVGQERKGDSQPEVDGKLVAVNGKREEVEMEKIEKNELGAFVDEALRKREAEKQEKEDFERLKSRLNDLEAKFCADDVCFLTKNELDVYLEKHSKDIVDHVDSSLKELKATLDEANQAKELAEEAKKPVLSPINERIRAGNDGRGVTREG